MIALEQVTKRYSQRGEPALNEVAFSIERGGFAFVIGDAGSGKSTIIRLLTRDEYATEGQVWVAGKDLGALADRDLAGLRRQVGVIHAVPRLIESLNVRDNIGFALHAIGIRGRRCNRQIEQALELTGLSDDTRRMPRDLSAGERQMLALARAIAKSPDVVLADEPTASLDADTSERIMGVLEQVNHNDVTVLVATHDHAIVDNFRKRVIELKNGRVVRDEFGGTYLDLFSAETMHGGATQARVRSARPTRNAGASAAGSTASDGSAGQVATKSAVAAQPKDPQRRNS